MMKNLVTGFYIVFFSLVLPTYADSGVVSPVEKYISKLTINVPTVSTQKLKEMLEIGDKVVLLDVRTFYEREQTNTILGEEEIHIPRGFLEIKAWKAVPKDIPIIVYCSKGTRSKLAVKTLHEMGWTNTSSLEGGVKAWYESANEPCGCLPEDKEIPDKKEQASRECKP